MNDDYEESNLTIADELEARPMLLETIDRLWSAVMTGLRDPECQQVMAKINEIEVIIGRKPAP